MGKLDEGFVTFVEQDFGNATIETTTIGQWNRNNVLKAREMYNALSPQARTAVTNYQTLVNTERMLGMSTPSEAVLAVIALTVLIVRIKLNSAAKRCLGMDLKQTAEMIGKGIKDEASADKYLSRHEVAYIVRGGGGT